MAARRSSERPRATSISAGRVLFSSPTADENRMLPATADRSVVVVVECDGARDEHANAIVVMVIETTVARPADRNAEHISGDQPQLVASATGHF